MRPFRGIGPKFVINSAIVILYIAHPMLSDKARVAPMLSKIRLASVSPTEVKTDILVLLLSLNHMR